MDVTAEKLTAAVDGIEVNVDLIGRDYPPGAWTTGRIRYPGAFASEVCARLTDAAGTGTASPDQVLYAGEAACKTYVPDEELEDEWRECGDLSRFVVSRSDGNENFGSGGGTEETCEKHLAATVSGMVNGNENIRAVVTVRWDKPGEEDGNDEA